MPQNGRDVTARQSMDAIKVVSPQMVKPFRLTYLAKGGVGCHPSSLNLNHCLSDLFLIVD